MDTLRVHREQRNGLRAYRGLVAVTSFYGAKPTVHEFSDVIVNSDIEPLPDFGESEYWLSDAPEKFAEHCKAANL